MREEGSMPTTTRRWTRPWPLVLAAALVACSADEPGIVPFADPADAADGSWFRAVQGRIAASEYAAKPTPDGFAATNRAHDLSISWGPDGTENASRHASSGLGGAGADGPLRLWTIAFGRADALTPADPAQPILGECLPERVDLRGECLRRVDLPRPGLVEWFDNGPAGLEQGWLVEQAPPGGGDLVVLLGVTGAESTVSEDALSAAFALGRERLRYGDLAVWDADGQTLAARFEADPLGLRIRVDDSGASYPVTIDPILSTSPWSVEPDQTGAWMGNEVSSAGDVNGDGFDDLIVSARNWDGGQSLEGAAFVYLGSATGPSMVPAVVLEADQAGARFGDSVASAGDVNGDGYGDVVVGAPNWTEPDPDEGAAFVYLGSPSGLSTTPAISWQSDQAGAEFGTSVSSAGDTNGDGFDDVLVGAWGWDDGEPLEGAVFVFQGSGTGPAAAPAATLQVDFAGVRFGVSVASAGDVNGDTYADVLVGAHRWRDGQFDEGGAFVFHGSGSGVVAAPASTLQVD